MDWAYLIVLISLLIVVSVKQVHLWPFWFYPMFSRYLNYVDLEVYALYLEDREGNLVLWKPSFYKLQRDFGQQYKPLLLVTEEDRQKMGALEYTLLRKMLFYMREDNLPISDYSALCVIKKTIYQSSLQQYEVEESLVLRLNIDDLERGVA